MTNIRLHRVRGGFAGHVEIDGVRLDPAPSLKHVRHSPDGFEWGYGGSGPAQLAFAILLHLTGDPDWSREQYRRYLQIGPASWPGNDGKAGMHEIEIDLETRIQRWGGRVLDRTSSASRQHFIDTGEYLTKEARA